MKGINNCIRNLDVVKTTFVVFEKVYSIQTFLKELPEMVVPTNLVLQETEDGNE